MKQSNPRNPIAPVASRRAKNLLGTTLACLEHRGISSMDDMERTILDFILQQFPLVGHAPAREAIARALHTSNDRIAAALERLDARDLVYLDPGAQEIRCAYPFSSQPTAHRVELPAGRGTFRRVFAVCAIDALGISFLLQRDVKIASSCPSCSGTLTIEVRGERITAWNPLRPVVWVGTDRRDHAATSVCQTMNMFCTRRHLEEWRNHQPNHGGERLSLGEALYLSKGLFEGFFDHRSLASREAHSHESRHHSGQR